MRQLKPLILLAALVVAVTMWQRHAPITTPDAGASSSATSIDSASRQPADSATSTGFLPPEANEVLARIAHGGPYAHRQDGGVFGNYEGLLPKQPRGFYHEYTVETPNARDRGARRIITGGEPPTEYYYSDDHYRSFRRFEANP